jgi:hypothetical protein
MAEGTFELTNSDIQAGKHDGFSQKTKAHG